MFGLYLRAYGKRSGVAEAVANLLLKENWMDIRFSNTDCTVSNMKYVLQFGWMTERSNLWVFYDGVLKNKENDNQLSWSYEQPKWLTFLKVIKWVNKNRRDYLFNNVI